MWVMEILLKQENDWNQSVFNQVLLKRLSFHLILFLTCRTIFQNSKNIYALHVTGTSLTTIMTEYWNNFDLDQKLRIRKLKISLLIYR